jgi:hypothetical protein
MRRIAIALVLLSLAIVARPSHAQAPTMIGGFEIGTYEGVPWPIVPPPFTGTFPPAPRFAAPPPAPTRAGERVVSLVDRIHSTLRASSYTHVTRIRPRDGLYDFDCSGMAAWVLRQAAPIAMQRITSERPVARDFVHQIESAPVDRARAGWQQLGSIADAMPGDLFAWRRPRGFPSHNTGHVGFVLDRPVQVSGIPGGWAVRIADSSSFIHQDDTRSGDADGGFGIGTIVFLADASGHGLSYGWYGTVSEGYVVTPILFGRVSR